MIKQGLIIGIDYTNEFCQICYYSMRHNRPESVTTGADIMRYLIPTALSYEADNRRWLVGNAAYENSQLTGSPLYTDFLDNSMSKESITLGEESFEYRELFAIFIGKLIEMAKAQTVDQKIYNVTICLRKITSEIKECVLDVFDLIGIEKKQVKLLDPAECFAYFALNEDSRLWAQGTLLFDFSAEGFYIRLLRLAGSKGKEMITIEEDNRNFDFSERGLDNNNEMTIMDNKLSKLFDEIYSELPVSSVYFAGSGFEELWFSGTLEMISEKIRAFKGNNIYVKGACLAGYRDMAEQKDFPIICDIRTKNRISIDVKSGGERKPFTLSEIATSWHDAGGKMDLIVDNTSWITFKITSPFTEEVRTIDFDLEEFPGRPNKATRIEVLVRYNNKKQCEIRVKDKGFGEFFESSGKEMSKIIDLED